MRTRSKRLGGLVAIAAASVLILGACGTNKGGGGTNQQQSSPGFAGGDAKPNTCTTGYDQIDKVEGSDNDKTVTVTFKTPYPDWKGLFAVYPAQVAAKSGDLNTPAGLAKAYEAFKAPPTWSGGPYKFGDFQKDVS